MATVKCNFVIYCICIFSSISYFRNNGKKKESKGNTMSQNSTSCPKKNTKKTFLDIKWTFCNIVSEGHFHV